MLCFDSIAGAAVDIADSVEEVAESEREGLMTRGSLSRASSRSTHVSNKAWMFALKGSASTKHGLAAPGRFAKRRLHSQ